MHSQASAKGFAAPALDDEEAARLAELARQARGDILTMTTLAQSGHPGGSMSSIDMDLTVWSYANVAPDMVRDPGRDRIVVSHGHTSPAVYSTLGRLGFFDLDEAVAHFRQAGSIFEGHVERTVPGVEWSTGNLGQGLSAACGMALASRLSGTPFHTFCMMSDGEQAKGQVAEARRFAKKYGLCDLTVLVDYNDIQISGHVHDIMPEDLVAHWSAAGWRVMEVDGHDISAIYAALHESMRCEDLPVVIIGKTVIGKGVPFMEDTPKYHGAPLSEEQYVEAMCDLGLEPRLEGPTELRATLDPLTVHPDPEPWGATVDVGEPRTYEAGAKTDNRSGWGNALTDLGATNIGEDGLPVAGMSPMAVFDCDLAGSVKTGDFWEAHPDNFFQMGVQEHTTAVTAAALSAQEVLAFWSDFGAFGVDETYNQHRLSDINSANLKVVVTHCGIDVGEDGKTHQCIDYVGVMRNAFGWKVVVPADANQTDRAVRWMATEPGNIVLAVGRSKLPTVTLEDGSPAFAGDWRFGYGKATLLRDGDDCALISTGTMTSRACQVHELLAEKGVRCRVIDVPTPLQLDSEIIAAAAGTGLLVTYEDHNAETGLGQSVAMWMADTGEAGNAQLMRLGAVRYESSGKPDALYARQGLDPEGVAERVLGTLRA